MGRKFYGLAVLALLAGAVFVGREPKTKVDAGETDKKEIRLLHYFGDTDTDASAGYLREILENEFEEAFPDVELVQEICDNQTYKMKIKVLMASDEAPDIMFGYGAGFSENFVKAERLLPLDDYLEDFYKEHMDMDMQKNFIYDGKQYGICYAYWTGVLYCNEELFQKAGAEIPRTYEELLTASKKLRAADIEPIACGMVNQWQGQMWVNNFTMQLGGAARYNAMAAGEESLDNGILERAAELTADLIEEDAFCRNMYQLSSNEAEEMFLNEEAAMIYIGSWYTSQAEERLGDKLKVVKMPELPQAKDTGDYHGGAINGWMVSADTKYPELSANIAAWLSYRLSCYQPESAAFLVEPGDEARKISKVSQEILDLYRDKDEGGCAWDTLMPGDKADIWLDMCSRLFETKVNGSAFARALGRKIG